MRSLRQHLILQCVAVLAFTAPILHAQELPELLSPVEAPLVKRLSSKSSYGLRAQLYFAKRYRLVKVNFDLLERAGAEFSVTPFSDLSMRIAARQLSGPSSFE